MSQLNQRGFTLIEILIALAIMAILSLMAWQGLDATIRGKEVIENQRDKASVRMDWARQFEIDCQNILQAQQIQAATVQSNVNFLWLLRNQSDSKGSYWQIVGYRQSPNGLERFVSPNFFQKSTAVQTWTTIIRNSDTVPPGFEINGRWSEVTKQEVNIFQETQNKLSTVRGIQVAWSIDKLSQPIKKICLTGMN